MAENGIKDFTVNWIIGGLLMFCLLAFTITFMYNNNSDALNDGTGDRFTSLNASFSDKLIVSSEDSDSLLNVTANTNPEVSDLGSRDSVAVSFGSISTPKSYWETSKGLISWVFSGTIGNILLGVIGGLIGFLGLFYIWMFIRGVI